MTARVPSRSSTRFRATPPAALAAQSAGWLFRGMWGLGGAYLAWRLAAGTLARLAGMLRSNAERKRHLEARMGVVEVCWGGGWLGCGRAEGGGPATV